MKSPPRHRHRPARLPCCALLVLTAAAAAQEPATQEGAAEAEDVDVQDAPLEADAPQDDAPQESEPPSEGTEDVLGGDEPIAVAGPLHDADDSGLAIDGSFSLWYVGRRTSGEDDHDLFSSLYLDVGDRERDPFRFHLHAYGALELAGDDPSFTHVNDTYDHDLVGRLYQAYVDVNRVDELEELRVGRQQIARTPVLAWFDGLWVETKRQGELDVQAGLYGGVPVHLFESSSEGDALYGLYVESRPVPGGRVRLDWMHLEDERFLGESQDDLYQLAWWQQILESWHVDAATTRLDGDQRDWRVGTTWYDPAHDLTLHVAHYRLLETQGLLSLEIDPFFGALRELFPYDRTDVLVSKGLGRHVVVEAGADVRRVDDEDDVGEFNRDYERYFLTTSFADAFDSGIDVALTGEVWESSATDIDTWGVDLSRDVGERTKLSLGSYYALFKYDVLVDEERDHVRTYYARAKVAQSDALSTDLRYEFEDSDLGDFHTLRAGLTWRF